MSLMSETPSGYPHTYGVQSPYDDYERISPPRRSRASSSSSRHTQAYGDTYGFPDHGVDQYPSEIDDTPSTPSSGRYERSDWSGGREEPSIGVRLDEAAAALTLERLELEHELFFDRSHSGRSIARHNARYNALRELVAAETAADSRSDGRSSEEENLPFDEEDPSSWERDRSLEDYRPGLVVRYHQFQEPPMPAPRRGRPPIPPGAAMSPAELSALGVESRSEVESRSSDWADKSDVSDSSGALSDSGASFQSQA